MRTEVTVTWAERTAGATSGHERVHRALRVLEAGYSADPEYLPGS